MLAEQMRREGYELTVGRPQVVTKTIDGVINEPMENTTIDVPEEYMALSPSCSPTVRAVWRT